MGQKASTGASQTVVRLGLNSALKVRDRVGAATVDLSVRLDPTSPRPQPTSQGVRHTLSRRPVVGAVWLRSGLLSPGS